MHTADALSTMHTVCVCVGVVRRSDMTGKLRMAAWESVQRIESCSRGRLPLPSGPTPHHVMLLAAAQCDLLMQRSSIPKRWRKGPRTVSGHHPHETAAHAHAAAAQAVAATAATAAAAAAVAVANRLAKSEGGSRLSSRRMYSIEGAQGAARCLRTQSQESATGPIPKAMYTRNASTMHRRQQTFVLAQTAVKWHSGAIPPWAKTQAGNMTQRCSSGSRRCHVVAAAALAPVCLTLVRSVVCCRRGRVGKHAIDVSASSWGRKVAF